MPKGKIVCRTCNRIIEEFESQDMWELYVMNEIKIKNKKLKCEKGHGLTCVQEIDANEFLSDGMKRELKIECIRHGCSKKTTNALFTKCEPWLVTAAAITFHSSHEGHRIRITYGEGKNKWSIESP